MGLHILENNKPFWMTANRGGVYTDKSIVSFNLFEDLKRLEYGTEIIFPQNSNKKLFINQAFLKFYKNKFYLLIGMEPFYQKNNLLTSGSLVESSNAQPISKLSFGTSSYKSISIVNTGLLYSFKIGHGWVKSSKYLENPYLHEKSINLKKKISKNSFLDFGLKHMALWAGDTEHHGKQPSDLNDFFRIIFAMPGDVNSPKQEQNNSLGNHLGAWSFLYEKKYKNNTLKLYFEHPFEDESGARWILNEFDGLYGISINQKESSYISKFTYEYINTMDQSGSEGASDSTYGWDNYYNHYIYQSGWTNNGRVIGNPLFTLGANIGRYSNGQYIINNRLKAHHFGLLGSISEKINYKILFTYSENFGTYPDQDFFKSRNKAYRFDGGLIQRSGLIELSSKNLFDKIDVSLAFGFDNGELLNKTDSFMLKINYKFVF